MNFLFPYTYQKTHWPVCQERKGKEVKVRTARKGWRGKDGKDSEEKIAR